MLPVKLPVLAFGAALLVLAAAPVSAQDEAGPALVLEGDSLVLEALGHRFSIPRPSWTDPAATNLAPLVSTSYDSDETDAVLEIFPRHESRAFWTTLYGAHISLSSGRPLGNYRDMAITFYASICKPEVTGFFQLGEDEGENLAPLGYVCGAHRDGIQGYSGKGEVMVMSFRRTETGVGVVYQEWRGQPFDPSNPALWPVETAIVQARAAELQRAATLTRMD